MKVAWSSVYCHPLPDGHRFPMEKYDLLPKQLMHEGIVDELDFFEPTPALESDILAVHDITYWQNLKHLKLDRKAIRATGFPLTQQLVDREILIMGGTIDCVKHALTEGVALNIAGGTHHAYTEHGEGFCLLNDIAISSVYALNKLGLKKILVVDLDVHQGNGTAQIFKHNSHVFTFSMHGAKNYPNKKEISDLDINMNDQCEDDIYLDTLQRILPDLIENTKPDLIQFQSGVDVLKSDKLGRLNISLDGCKIRDEIVFSEAHKHSIPIVVTMGGGYSEDIKIIVNAHANTYKMAKYYYG